MRILLVASFRLWDLGRFLHSALEGLGHSVAVYDYRREARFLQQVPLSLCGGTGRWGTARSNRKLVRYAREIRPDLTIVVKGENVWPATIASVRELGSPCFLWFPDDPHLFAQVSSAIAGAYDWVFTSSSHAVDWYHEIGVRNVEWIGFACEPSVHRKLELTHEQKRQYAGDLVFVGTYYPERLALIRRLRDFDLKVWGPGWRRCLQQEDSLASLFGGDGAFLEELAVIYNARKIVLNLHPVTQRFYGLKANMRVYEAVGCGSCLVTDHATGIEDVFSPGKELATFRDPGEAPALIESLLADASAAAELGRNGQQRAYERHSYTHRARQILAALDS